MSTYLSGQVDDHRHGNRSLLYCHVLLMASIPSNITVYCMMNYIQCTITYHSWYIQDDTIRCLLWPPHTTRNMFRVVRRLRTYIYVLMSLGWILAVAITGSCALNLISVLLLSLGLCICWWTITGSIHLLVDYNWVYTSAGGLYYPEVSVSAMTWFITYIYYWNLTVPK
jgi:hypothetical protein